MGVQFYNWAILCYSDTRNLRRYQYLFHRLPSPALVCGEVLFWEVMLVVPAVRHHSHPWLSEPWRVEGAGNIWSPFSNDVYSLASFIFHPSLASKQDAPPLGVHTIWLFDHRVPNHMFTLEPFVCIWIQHICQFLKLHWNTWIFIYIWTKQQHNKSQSSLSDQ